MKVLFLIDTLKRGGAEGHTIRLARALHDAGQEIRIVCIDQARRPAEELAPLIVEPLDCPGLTGFSGLKALRQLRQVLLRWQPEILHCVLFEANLLGPAAARTLARHHRPAVIACKRDTGFWLRRRHAALLRCVRPWVNRYCANSEAVRGERMRIERIPPHRISCIYNSVDLNRYQCAEGNRSDLGIHAEGYCLLYAGRFRPEKGHRELLQAFACAHRQASDMHLLLAGSGPLEQDLRREVETMKLGNVVHFLGERRDIPELLSVADAAVLPSGTEGFSNFALEALAAGIPLVATAVGGTKELIQDQVNGLLIPAGDVSALADAMLRLFRAPDLAEKLSRAGLSTVQNRYAPEREWGEYMSLYNQVVQ